MISIRVQQFFASDSRPHSIGCGIIRLVEQSHLPVRRTLDKIGIPRATFYRWYDLYRCCGPEALEDGRPGPDRAWNRIPEEVQRKLIDLALEEPDLSPRSWPCASPRGKVLCVGGLGLSAAQGP